MRGKTSVGGWTGKGRARLLRAALFLALWLCMSGSVFAAEASPDSADAEVLKLLIGKTAGATTGTPQDQIIRSSFPDAEILYFNTVTDMCLALQEKKIDFYVFSTVNYYSVADQYPELGYLDVPLVTYDVGTIFPMTEEGDGLRREMNAYIAGIKESGELEKLQNEWLFPKDVWEEIDLPKTGEKGTLIMATPNTMKPFSFMVNDKNVGFDIAVAAGFCREYGYGLKIENVDFAGVLSGIETGRYDMAAGQISWTAERAEKVLYSDFYYTQELVPIVRSAEYDCSALVTAGADAGETNAGEMNAEGEEASAAAAKTAAAKGTVWQSLRKTLLDENRWQTILRGLLVTAEITMGGFALANLLGAVFCAMAMSKRKGLRITTAVYSGLMQGLPIVVILMLLYYVVFAHSRMNNVVVAIIGFGLVFGAYMAQLFEGGIGGVEKGQWEASLAIGFTKRQTFFGIVLPQAVRTMLPGYFSNLISLMKGTAVVGYIAVADLTRAGDIIRSSTYEAFAPLIVIAAIYFAISCLLLALMKQLQKKLAPRRTADPAGKPYRGGEEK